MTLRPGEIVLIRIEFHQASGGKLRLDRIALAEILRRAFSIDP
jgi:hypothetical protein